MEPPRSDRSGTWFAGVRVVVHVDAARSEGRFGVWESEEPQGVRLPLHVHRREDEQVVLLDGRITVWVGGRRHELEAGDTLALPRGVPHAHLVTSQKARTLTIASPGGFERLFAEPPPDTAALTEAVGRLGVEIVGPPPSVDD